MGSWLSDAGDWLFGGTDDSAQEAQTAANRRAQEFIEEQAELARNDVLALQPYVDESRDRGYQTASRILSRGLGSTLGMTGRSSQAAQDALLAGLPQQQNAILGMPVDMSVLQSTNMNPAPSGVLDWAMNYDMQRTPAPENYTRALNHDGPTDEQIQAFLLAGGYTP